MESERQPEQKSLPQSHLEENKEELFPQQPLQEPAKKKGEELKSTSRGHKLIHLVEEDKDEEDEATVRKKKRVTQEESEDGTVSSDQFSIHLTTGTTISLSGAIQRVSQSRAQVELFHDCRIISKEVMNTFSRMNQDKLVSLATKNQVLHLREWPTKIDFEDYDSVMEYMTKNSHNYRQIFSLAFLATGGESLVLRADLKQPIEAVLKTILPANGGQGVLTNILSESHLIKILDNKDHVVEIYEEIIEFNKDTSDLLNYFAVVEQAIFDLHSILEIQNEEKLSIKNMEFFSEEKLFYFMFEAVKALNYLHENNFYYGDMKTKNLLVFRDYSVKIGDFGISLKLDEESDPDEALYELKGVSPGYGYKHFERGFIDNEQFSRNQLIENDYECLRNTFQSIYSTFKPRLSQKSYFLDLMNDIQVLSVQNSSLNYLVSKYTMIIQEDQSFIFGLCGQLREFEKYQAIPQVLKLSKHRILPSLIKSYFYQEEIKEFRFLNYPQKTTIPEDSVTAISKQLSQEEVIVQLQSYIEKEMTGVELFTCIEYLIRFRSFLSPTFTNQFYRQLFSKYFSYNDGQGRVFDLSMSLEGIASLIINKSADLRNHKEDNYFKFVVDCAIFLGYTGIISPQVILKIISSLTVTDRNGELALKHVPHRFLEASYQLYLLHLRVCVESNTKFNYNIHVFESRSQINLLLQEIQELQNGANSFQTFELGCTIDKQRELASKYTLVQECYMKIQEQLNSQMSDKAKELKNLQVCRKELKRVHGELGNQMSENAFLIYQKMMNIDRDPWEKRQQGQLNTMPQAPQRYSRLSFILLYKACSYSTKEQKQEFLIDLILEYKRLQLNEKLPCALKELQNINMLLYRVITKYLDNARFHDNEISKEVFELFFQENNYKLVQKIMAQSDRATQVMIFVFKLDEELLKQGSDYLFRQLKYEIIIRKAKTMNYQDKLFFKTCDICLQSPSSDAQMVTFNLFGQSQIKIELVKFIKHGSLSEEDSSGILFEEIYNNSVVDGSSKYDRLRNKMPQQMKDEKSKLTGKDNKICQSQKLFCQCFPWKQEENKESQRTKSIVKLDPSRKFACKSKTMYRLSKGNILNLSNAVDIEVLSATSKILPRPQKTLDMGNGKNYYDHNLDTQDLDGYLNDKTQVSDKPTLILGYLNLDKKDEVIQRSWRIVVGSKNSDILLTEKGIKEQHLILSYDPQLGWLMEKLSSEQDTFIYSIKNS